MSPPASNGPAYPLTREQFRRALATGHGRAWIHVERFGAAEFRDEILEAATNNQVCDPQVNGTRGKWLADLCLAAGVAEAVVAQPIPEDAHDRGQRIALLLELARRGIAGARMALYECFGRARGSNDCHASREIIELDGEAGLLFVVRAMGVLLASEPGFSVWGYELSVFDEQHGEGSGRALLEREAASDASVGAYLEDVRRYEVRLEQERGQRAQLADESAGRTADGARMSGHEDLQLETLRRSARAGDAGTLLRALESLREAEPDQLHGAGSTALELLEECPALPGAAIVLEIYAWNPCAHCRGLALEELLRLGACPRWVLDEAAHDGTPWIRELAASARSPQPPPPAVS